MTISNILTGILAIAVLGLSSCIRYDDERNYNNVNYNNTNVGYASIKGHVSLYDIYGNLVSSKPAGIQINLIGNYSKATQTDTTGYYAFARLNSNTYYNIYVADTASLQPYGNTVLYAVHLNDTLTQNISLSAIPAFAPLSFTGVKDSATQSDSIYLSFSADTMARAALVVVNNNTSVSTSSLDYLLAYVVNIPAHATQVSFGIAATDMHHAGISSGNMAYFAAYGYVVNDHSLYKDQSSGKYMYTAVSNAAVTGSVRVP